MGKGIYFGDYYVRAEYEDYIKNGDLTIIHELAHSYLTERTVHGFLYIGMSQIHMENFPEFSLSEVVEIIHDASERTEESYAILFTMIMQNDTFQDLVNEYSIFKTTESYHRYHFPDCESILLSAVPKNVKIDFLNMIFSFAMNTEILKVNLDWFDVKEIVTTFGSNPLSYIPDKRLCCLLDCVNNLLKNMHIDDITEEVLCRASGLKSNAFTVSESTMILEAFVTISEKHQLRTEYVQTLLNASKHSNQNTITPLERVLFYFNPYGLKYFKLLLLCEDLYNCQMFELYLYEGCDIGIFTSFELTEKYIVNVPSRELLQNFINNYNGLLVVRLEDIDIFQDNYVTGSNTNMIIRADCNYHHLKDIFEKNEYYVEKTFILNVTDNLCLIISLCKNVGYVISGTFSKDCLEEVNKLDVWNNDTQDSILVNQNYSVRDFIPFLTYKTENISDDNTILYFQGDLTNKCFAKDYDDAVKIVNDFYKCLIPQLALSYKWRDIFCCFQFMVYRLNIIDEELRLCREINDFAVEFKNKHIQQIVNDHILSENIATLLKLVLSYTVDIIGYENKDTCMTTTNIANLYFESQNMQEAFEYAVISLNVKRKVYGDTSDSVAKAYYLLGIIFLRCEKYSECKSNLEKALNLAHKNNNNSLTAQIQKILEQIEET